MINTISCLLIFIFPQMLSRATIHVLLYTVIISALLNDVIYAGDDARTTDEVDEFVSYIKQYIQNLMAKYV